MKRATWRRRIRQACEQAGTYEPQFEYVIDTLAQVLEKRDEAAAEYAQDPKPIVRYTNKGGASNPIKNPALVLWDDLNKSALAYWRDLGLTPSGLKKLKGDSLDGAKESPLLKALNELD